jgi:hypothetical protein
MGERVGLVGMLAMISVSSHYLFCLFRSAVLEQSTLRTSYTVGGHAAGYLTFNVPGALGLIDAYAVVRNDEDIDQGYLNSTLRWSTTSSWKHNGDMYLFGDLSLLKTTSQTLRSWKVREALTYGDNQYRASSYLLQDNSETLSAFGEGQYSVVSGYNW